MMGPYVTAALVRDHRARLLRQADAHKARRLARAAPIPAEPVPPPSCPSPWADEHPTLVLRTSGTCPPVVDAEPAA
jgi:hypothetical protein